MDQFEREKLRRKNFKPNYANLHKAADRLANLVLVNMLKGLNDKELVKAYEAYIDESIGKPNFSEKDKNNS